MKLPPAHEKQCFTSTSNSVLSTLTVMVMTVQNGGMFLTSEKHKWRQFAELKSANSAKPKDGEHYSCWSMTNKMALSVELTKPPYWMIHQHYRSCPYHWDDSFRNKVFLSSRRWHAFSGRSYLIPNGTFPSHKQKWHCITPEGGSTMDLQTRIK